jgi:hypothetical protein
MLNCGPQIQSATLIQLLSSRLLPSIIYLEQPTSTDSLVRSLQHTLSTMPVPFEALIPFGKLERPRTISELTNRPVDGHVWSYGDVILYRKEGTK